MADFNEERHHIAGPTRDENKRDRPEERRFENKPPSAPTGTFKSEQPEHPEHPESESPTYFRAEDQNHESMAEQGPGSESRPNERGKGPGRSGARGTAAMDPKTRQEVARKGGLAVSRNRQHMAEIGRKGGQSVSKNREHMAQIGRKGGAASRGHR